jgi:hypothetical protein
MNKLVKSKKSMLRIELLPFFEIEELVKFAILSREFIKLVDPNRDTVDSDNFLNIHRLKD